MRKKYYHYYYLVRHRIAIEKSKKDNLAINAALGQFRAPFPV